MDFPSNSIHQPITPKIQRPIPTGNEPPSPVTHGEEKVVRKVVAGPAIRRKKTIFSRLRALIVPDGKTLYESVFQDVLGPALREMVLDAIIRGAETAVYGEPRTGSRRGGTHRAPVGASRHIPYNQYTASPTPRETRIPARGRTHDFGQIELNTRAEAEEIVAQMDEIIDRYGHTSVRDLNEMVGLESEYTDEKWGWRDLRGADVRRLRNGSYVLELPRPEAL